MTTTAQKTTLRFASALSHLVSAEEAGEEVARAVRDSLGTDQPDLACLFFSGHYAATADRLLSAIRSLLKSTVLIGCTGEGIIAQGQEFEEAPAVTLWAARLPGVRMSPVHLPFDGDDVETGVPDWPFETEAFNESLDRESPLLLMLADPFTTPVKDSLDSLHDIYPSIRAIGGLAGGGREPGEHRLILDDRVFDRGLVGVLLSGPVSVHTVISQGCRPIGERYIVTRSDHNVIYELGGVSALDQLQQAFESLTDDEKQHAQRALHLGIAMDEHRDRFDRGDFLVRNILGADRSSGSIAVGDTVQEGQTVQFHLRDAESASEDLNLLLAAEQNRAALAPKGGLIFSCCGRGHHLFGHLHHDAETVHNRFGGIPVSGFFCQGEIGPVGPHNFLHGYTASIALFFEPDP